MGAVNGSALSPLDRTVLTTIAACLAVVVLLIWRGDRVGLRVVDFSPADGAGDVSPHTAISVRFDAPLALGAGSPFRIEPTVTGPVLWKDDRVELRPADALQAGRRYTVTLAQDLAARDGRQLRREQRWSFSVGGSALVFLRRAEGSGLAQLWRVDPDGAEARTLADEPETGIWDYAVAPDGQRVAYTVVLATGASQLIGINRDGSDRRLLLDCPDAECSGPSWAPDGQTLVYEKRVIPPGGGPSGPPRLWWLRPESAQTVPVLNDSQQLGFGARFAPDGKRLAYVSPDDGAIRILDLGSQSETLVESEMGESPAWSPDGQRLLVGRVAAGRVQFAVHLLLVELNKPENRPLDLSPVDGPPVEDGLPVWSPDGDWIAFTRRYTAGPDLNLGRQVWLMRPDGSESRRLSRDQTQGYGQPSWSPDGKLLALQSISIADLGAEPALLVLDAADGSLRARVERALQPNWLP